jgi:hypothetical protein
MLVMKTINKKQRGSSLSLSQFMVCALIATFPLDARLGNWARRVCLFIYLCIHCTMSPHSPVPLAVGLLSAVHAQDYIRPRAHNKAFTLNQAWKTFCRLKTCTSAKRKVVLALFLQKHCV